ncbi:putative secretory lipase [Rhizodiscina lignyota]|uniref:Secretory lipase n=1 Tax=Rhizodiscina lignyota TaxID=1504668 RepID=A0A9P4IFR4_9PEZI|nr:putative secretory lipase [Rhizodiscina lignyota]
MQLTLLQKHFSGIFSFLLLTEHIYAQNASASSIQSTTCGEQCQELARLGSSWEQTQHAHSPLDSFYSVPRTFSSSAEPGELLRVELHTNLTNYTVPSGLTMSRIMYTSRDLNGTTVPVSAYILWPYTPFVPSEDGKPRRSSKGGHSRFPLVAWAHGTAGLFPACAPSNYRSLQYHFMVPYNVALEGFAVIAPDYAGLGVGHLPNGDSIRHEYLAGPAAANDLAYAIEAARKAFPEQLTNDGPFVAMGHSQGGHVAWAFAERQAVLPVAGYRGTISISPLTRVIDQVQAARQIASSAPASSLPIWIPVTLSIQPKLVAAVTAVYPSYNYSGMTPVSYDRWNNVLAPVQGCLPTDGLVFSDVPIEGLVKPGWTEDRTVQDWADRVAVSGKKFRGPLLVIVGDQDVVPLEGIEQAVDASCRVDSKEDLEQVTYAGMEHFPVIQASRMRWMDWIKERTIEQSWGGDGICGKKSFVEGYNTNYTLHPITPNWLVEAVNAEDAWQLAL